MQSRSHVEERTRFQDLAWDIEGGRRVGILTKIGPGHTYVQVDQVDSSESLLPYYYLALGMVVTCSGGRTP